MKRAVRYSRMSASEQSTPPKRNLQVVKNELESIKDDIEKCREYFKGCDMKVFDYLAKSFLEHYIANNFRFRPWCRKLMKKGMSPCKRWLESNSFPQGVGMWRMVIVYENSTEEEKESMSRRILGGKS